MTKWKKYEGTDGQIYEILNARDGFVLRNNGVESNILRKLSNEIVLTGCDYLICEPHPLAEVEPPDI